MVFFGVRGSDFGGVFFIFLYIRAMGYFVVMLIACELSALLERKPR